MDIYPLSLFLALQSIAIKYKVYCIRRKEKSGPRNSPAKNDSAIKVDRRCSLKHTRGLNVL